MIFKSAKHCRHAAGSTAVMAMSVQFIHLPHIMEPVLFGISALLTVYEPLLVRGVYDEKIDVPEYHNGEHDINEE